MRTRTWTTEVSKIALCTSCSRIENKKSFGSVFHFSGKQLYIHRKRYVVDYKKSRFSAKISSFTQKLNTGKHNFSLVNTYRTILVAFYNPYKFQKIF